MSQWLLISWRFARRHSQAWFFTINFLRKKRPLSAVAPMLAFCNFLVFFGAVLMIKRAQFELLPWVVLCMIAALSVFLHRENKAQNNVIFRDSW